MGCYIRVLVSDLVQTCSNGVNEVTAETMDNVMDCGKDQVKEFVMENARYISLFLSRGFNGCYWRWAYKMNNLFELSTL